MTRVHRRETRILILGLIATLGTSVACAPRAMRGGAGTDNPGMDAPAMSTTLDRADIDYLVSQNIEALYSSRFWLGEIAGEGTPPIFAIWPIENSTSEHLEDQMLTLLSSIETSLVNSGEVQVVAKSRQAALAREIGIQQGAIYDAERAARLGRQLGASYFVTGKITGVDERLQKTRRVQYSLFLQVLELETGLVKFQHEATRSKALKR
jgi:penicillin-binding protein activator